MAVDYDDGNDPEAEHKKGKHIAEYKHLLKNKNSGLIKNYHVGYLNKHPRQVDESQIDGRDKLFLWGFGDFLIFFIRFFLFLFGLFLFLRVFGVRQIHLNLVHVN